MYGINELIGGSGSFPFDGYNLPGDKEWYEEILEVLHAKIPGSHDLLIAIVLTQEFAVLREQSSMSLAVVLSEYESTLGQADALRARTFLPQLSQNVRLFLMLLKSSRKQSRIKYCRVWESISGLASTSWIHLLRGWSKYICCATLI